MNTCKNCGLTISHDSSESMLCSECFLKAIQYFEGTLRAILNAPPNCINCGIYHAPSACKTYKLDKIDERIEENIKEIKSCSSGIFYLKLAVLFIGIALVCLTWRG